MAHYELTTPVSEDAVRALRVNDTVTLHATLYGIRDATQIALFDRGRTTRFALAGHAVIHTAPNVKRVPPSPAHPAGYAPVCVGTTTSARMERFTRPLLAQHGVRLIIGKGGLGRGQRRRVPRVRRRVSRDRRRHRGAGDDVDRGDRGRRPRRPESRRACGASASAASVRCWSRWTATAAASTKASTARRANAAPRRSPRWA